MMKVTVSFASQRMEDCIFRAILEYVVVTNHLWRSQRSGAELARQQCIVIEKEQISEV